jgi:hypothetical protein
MLVAPILVQMWVVTIAQHPHLWLGMQTLWAGLVLVDVNRSLRETIWAAADKEAKETIKKGTCLGLKGRRPRIMAFS